MLIALVLALVGLSLIYMEFFMPGGILAVFGTGALIAALAVFGYRSESFWGTLLAFFGLLALVGIVCKVALWRVQASQTIFLKEDQEGFVACSFDPELVGREGIALSDLKPSGHISVEGKLWHALSESGYIHKGEPVIVIGGAGWHLKVKSKE